jgi:hypothetical protein
VIIGRIVKEVLGIIIHVLGSVRMTMSKGRLSSANSVKTQTIPWNPKGNWPKYDCKWIYFIKEIQKAYTIKDKGERISCCKNN